MECPFCKKEIYAMTGLQEIQKFEKHLKTCRKNPKRKVVVTESGDLAIEVRPTGMLEALQIRADSGQ